MQALHDVVQAGYVRYIGMSSCHAYQCKRNPNSYRIQQLISTFISPSPPDAEYVPAHTRLELTCRSSDVRADYAINNKLTPFISMQNHYSLVYREEEREMFPTLKVRKLRRIILIPPANSKPDVRRWVHPLVSARPWAPHAPCRSRHYSRQI